MADLNWLADLDAMRRLDPEPGPPGDPREECRARRRGLWHEGCVRNGIGRHVMGPCRREQR